MDSDEFSTSPVPLGRSIPWWKIALTNVLFSICLPTLITGLDLGIAAPRRNFLSVIIVPVLAVVCLLMLLESLKQGSVASILGRAPLAGMSFGDTVSSVVGGVIVGAVIMPDTCRFIERPHGAVWTAVLTYFVSSAGIMVIGGLAALALHRTE